MREFNLIGIETTHINAREHLRGYHWKLPPSELAREIGSRENIPGGAIIFRPGCGSHSSRHSSIPFACYYEGGKPARRHFIILPSVSSYRLKSTDRLTYLGAHGGHVYMTSALDGG